MTTTFEPIIGPATKSDDWYAYRFYDPERSERPVMIGASEGAAACGMSIYKTPLELYLEKRREVPAFQGNEATRLGQRLEPVILDEYEDREQVTLNRDLPLYFHPIHAFIGATPDATRSDNERPVEAKKTSWRMYDKEFGDPTKFGQEETDQVPMDYLLQAQQQCLVLDKQEVDVPVLFDGSTLRIYRVERNQDLIDHLIACETELAQRIIDGNPPEPNWENSNTRYLLREMYGFSADKIVELDDSYRDLWMEYQRQGDIEKKAQGDREVIRNKLLAAMKDAQVARFPGAGFELNRVQVKASTYTVNRKASEQLRQRKVK